MPLKQTASGRTRYRRPHFAPIRRRLSGPSATDRSCAHRARRVLRRSAPQGCLRHRLAAVMRRGDTVFDGLADRLRQAAKLPHIEIYPAGGLPVMALGDKEILRLNDARVADQTPARLQYHLRHLIAEMLVHRRHDGVTVACRCRHVVEIVGSLAEVDRVPMTRLFVESVEERGRFGNRGIPLLSPSAASRHGRKYHGAEGHSPWRGRADLRRFRPGSRISLRVASPRLPFVTRRQKTRLLGAARPSFSISAALSKAKKVSIPAACAFSMSDLA